MNKAGVSTGDKKCYDKVREVLGTFFTKQEKREKWGKFFR